MIVTRERLHQAEQIIPPAMPPSDHGGEGPRDRGRWYDDPVYAVTMIFSLSVLLRVLLAFLPETESRIQAIDAFGTSAIISGSCLLIYVAMSLRRLEQKYF